jgi:hypothetical protein
MNKAAEPSFTVTGISTVEVPVPRLTSFEGTEKEPSVEKTPASYRVTEAGREASKRARIVEPSSSQPSKVTPEPREIDLPKASEVEVVFCAEAGATGANTARHNAVRRTTRVFFECVILST